MNKLPSYTFSTEEINFLAEQEPLTILPRYTMSGTRLIGAKLPDLKALQREQVPAWLALVLKKQNKCNVVIPSWLGVTFLKQRYDEEISQPNQFSALPWHWLPLSKLLLDKCTDDFTEPPHEIRSLLQDLREVRQLKARKGIKELNDEYLQLDGLSLMEINEIRPFIIQSTDQLRVLAQSVGDTVEKEEDEDEASIPDEKHIAEANVSKATIYDTREDDEDSDIEYRVND